MAPNPASSALDDLLRCAHRALVARAFVELSLADHLHEGPTSISDLAAATQSNQATLSRLLRAASANGLCTETDGGYVLTAAAGQLRSDAPGGAANWLLMMTAPWMTRAWEGLADAVRSGKPSFPAVHGQGFWEYVATHPENAGMFDAAMTSGALTRAEDLLAALDWSSLRVVVDVGGGQGLLAASLVGRIDHLRAVVVDRAEVVATPAPAAQELGSRVDMVAADFFTSVPGGGDVYLLSRILHDWPDEDAVTILRRCREAMGQHAQLCILEQVAPDNEGLNNDEQFDLAIKDLNMLVLVGGQERTSPEYTSLLTAAGLQFQGIHRGNACDVILARPADAV